MKVILLPETDYVLATEHHIPEDSYDHQVLRCPCQPYYERDGNKVIVHHTKVVERGDAS